MKFSVLMSVYDKENPAYLRQSIDSIYNQTLLPDEVILIEDGPLTPELNDTISTLNNKHNTLKVMIRWRAQQRHPGMQERDHCPNGYR